MTEWWTYGLSDFLMFSPQAYWRLVARYNAAWWPAQVLAVAASIGVVALLRRRHARALLVVLAIAWAWVGWAFHLQRYAEIFLAARWLAGAFFVQALLLGIATILHRDEEGPERPGIALAFAGLACAWPLLGPATGHPWREAEVFGFMPDPTALLTVAAVLGLQGLPLWRRVLLLAIPVLSLLLGSATRWLLVQ